MSSFLGWSTGSGFDFIGPNSQSSNHLCIFELYGAIKCLKIILTQYYLVESLAWWDCMALYFTSIGLPLRTLDWPTVFVLVFTCVSYAEARNRYRLDVRLSVRPSVTRWYCVKTAQSIVKLSSLPGSPIILVLCVSRSSRNSDGVTPCGAAKQRYENVTIFDE